MQEWLLLNLTSVGAAGAAAISVIVAASVHSSAKKRIAQLERHIDLLGKELNALSHSTIGMGRKLQAVDGTIEVLDQSIHQIQANDPSKVSYSEAARLVKMGASVEDLMHACSISRPEAELVSALTKQKHDGTPSQQRENDEVPILNTKV